MPSDIAFFSISSEQLFHKYSISSILFIPNVTINFISQIFQKYFPYLNFHDRSRFQNKKEKKKYLIQSLPFPKNTIFHSIFN